MRTGIFTDFPLPCVAAPGCSLLVGGACVESAGAAPEPTSGLPSRLSQLPARVSISFRPTIATRSEHERPSPRRAPGGYQTNGVKVADVLRSLPVRANRCAPDEGEGHSPSSNAC